jgi:phage terminase large subunit-like protein
MSCYELVCHITGTYPDWWEGKVLQLPHNWWVVGENSNLIRQSIITTLLGPVGEYGTGLIRHKDLDFASLTDTTKVTTTVTAFRVKHSSGKYCQIDFKTYEMGRTAFQAAEVNVLFDEEPPPDIFSECLTRTASLGDEAMTLMNFTPLKGAGPLIEQFLDGGAIKTGPINETKHLTHLTWDDAPHLSEATKKELIEMYPVYIRDARTKGLPVVGEGAVYPIAEEKVFIDPLPFPVPDHWKRYFSLDFGWKDPTAITWHAIDPDSGIDYQYAEHYLSEAPVGTHAEIIKAQNKIAGFMIPGVCDPSGGGRSIVDGVQARQMYMTDYGIPMVSADNAIETGIAKTYQAMINGKLKVFTTCPFTRKEFRTYSRFKAGFKGADHAMDTLRYGQMTGRLIAKSKMEVDQAAAAADAAQQTNLSTFGSTDSWMMS